MGGQRAAISAKSEVAPGCRHRVSPTAWRTPALLSPQGGLSFSLWRGGVGCFIGALLCPIDSAVLARGVLAEIPLFFYAAGIAAAMLLLFFRKSATVDILT